MSLRDRLFSGGAAYVGIAAIIGYVVLAAELGEGFAIPVAIIATISTAVILRGPLGKALARRLEGAEPELSEDVLHELDDLRARVLELEERQDFSERLLARQGREDQVATGQDRGTHAS